MTIIKVRNERNDSDNLSHTRVPAHCNSKRTATLPTQMNFGKVWHYTCECDRLTVASEH